MQMAGLADVERPPMALGHRASHQPEDNQQPQIVPESARPPQSIHNHLDANHVLQLLSVT